MMGGILAVDEDIVVGQLLDAEVPALGGFGKSVCDGGILKLSSGEIPHLKVH